MAHHWLAPVARLLALAVALALLTWGAVALVGALRPADPPPAEGCVTGTEETPVSVDLEQAANASIIAGITVQRGLPARAASIALATAWQESGLRNLNYGDRDSLGLFQQRPSQGWGTATQIMDPRYATGKFLDALVRVPGWQTGDVNDVAQAVQRSGVPNGYRRHVEGAKLLASALTGHTPAALSCINRSTATGDAKGLAESMRATFGNKVKATADGDSLSIVAASPEVAWATAAYALANTAGFGTQSVQVAGRRLELSGASTPSWNPAEASRDQVTVEVVVRAG